MRILFLHGWQSVPGGVKPTYLKDHGHTVFNPALNDEDFAQAVRTAQDEFDQHQPQVVVGSSRGGAVAMNIQSGAAKLVLLCPAWKKYGTTRTVKPGTVILHSRADDVIPFAESEELAKYGGATLIEIGSDHRLADPEPLEAMLRACERAAPENIQDTDVCRYFLQCEFAKGSFHSDPAAFSDDDVRRAMTEFGQQHSSNPAVIWLGFSPKDKRTKVKWRHLEQIGVHSIYSNGLNPDWKAALQGVNGNLVRFIAECKEAYKAEYDRADQPPADLSLILGIIQKDRPGEIELIDGSHRLAAMIRKGVTVIGGYVGVPQ